MDTMISCSCDVLLVYRRGSRRWDVELDGVDPSRDRACSVSQKKNTSTIFVPSVPIHSSMENNIDDLLPGGDS